MHHFRALPGYHCNYKYIIAKTAPSKQMTGCIRRYGVSVVHIKVIHILPDFRNRGHLGYDDNSAYMKKASYKMLYEDYELTSINE